MFFNFMLIIISIVVIINHHYLSNLTQLPFELVVDIIITNNSAIMIKNNCLPC